jgi:hypothetical protein
MALLQSLTAMSDLAAIDLTTSVLMDLVKRDERNGAALKLGDKLVKWAGAEVEKAVASPKSYVPKHLVTN